MTVLQANKFFYLKGGAERHMLELSAFLEARGETVVPFAMEHPENLASPYRLFFPSFVETGHPSFADLPKLLSRLVYSPEVKRNMRSLLETVPPDVAHVHNIYTQLSPSLLVPLAKQGVPIVMTVHDHHLVSPAYVTPAPGCGTDIRGLSVWGAAKTRFLKDSFAASLLQATSFELTRRGGWYKRLVDRFITPSAYLKRQMVVAGFEESRITVIPNGIDLKRFRPNKSHEGYVLFVGRLSHEKGMDVLLELAARFPDLPFWVVGEGEESHRLHTQLHALPNVKLLGFKSGEELASLYRRALCLLMPAQNQENFPYVILEAMASGIPVIASHVGGIPEMVDDTRTGFLVSPRHVHGFAEALTRLSTDIDRRFEMGREARRVAEVRFDASLSFERIVGVYREVMEEKR